jgi:collagen type VI alpha
VVFVLDSSGSICESQGGGPSCENWQLLKQFVKNIINDMDIGENKTRVGMVKFANIGENLWFLNTYTTKTQLLGAVDSIAYAEGNTNTSGGLRAMHYQQFIQHRGDRTEITKIAFVITDGVSTFDSEKTIPDAQAARHNAIQIFSIGVTDRINMNELREISSEPQEEKVNYFTSVDFGALDEIVTTLVQSTCSGTPADCTQSRADIVFVIDSSGSIRDQNPPDGSYDNYELLLGFVNSIVDKLNIGMNLTRVGAVRFSDYGDNVFYLNTYTSKEDVKNAISRTGYMGGNTNTSGGIRAMFLNQFTQARGDREDVQNIAIVITDGKSTFDSARTVPDANSAKNAGITVFSVGITNATNEDELRLISSPPQQMNQNYWLSADFNSLNTMTTQIVAETCKTENEGNISKPIINIRTETFWKATRLLL